MNIEIKKTIEINVECEGCGAGLVVYWDEYYERLTVEICNSCIEDSRKEEWRDGHEQGYKEGKQDGLDQSGRCSCTR